MADDRRQLDELLDAVDARLSALLAPLARDLARLVRRAPKDASGTLSPAGRLGIARWLDGALAALFGDSPADAEGKYAAPGTVPHLLAGATRAAARLAVGPVVADVTARLSGRPDLLAALATPPPGARTPLYDPARTWLDPNGHTLSSRIWQNGEDVKARIDAVLDYGIRSGASTVDIATALEDFLTVEGRFKRVLERQPDGSMRMVRKPITTRTPYGTSGLYAPRRLARTETTRAYGVATIESARANPFVRGVKWNLSASHVGTDECDTNASRDDYGLGRGVYPPDKVPRYPNHPQDKCYLTQVTASDSEARARIRAILAGGDGLPLDEATIAASVTGFGQ